MKKCKREERERERKKNKTLQYDSARILTRRKITRKYLLLPAYENSKLKLASGKEHRTRKMKEGRAEKRKPRKLFQRGDIPGRRKFERVSIKPRTVALKKWGEREREREKKRKKGRKKEKILPC